MPDTDQPVRPFKVIIVGGGIAGLATAHALLRAKVPNLRVRVYEQRSEDTAFVKYPMHIAPDGRSALRSILSPESYAALTASSTYDLSHGGITIHTPQLTRLFSMRRYDGEQPQFVHRWVLRRALGEGVDVVRGKRVVRAMRVEPLHPKEPGEGEAAGPNDGKSDGTGGSHGVEVEVVFEDGSTELADLVVGADGVGSTLRSQLSPAHARFPLLPYITVQFKLATAPSALRLPDESGINLFLGTRGDSLLLVRLHGSPLPQLTPRAALSLAEGGPFAEPDPSVLAVKAALEDHKTGYVYGVLTLPSFAGWEDLIEAAWIEKASQLLRADDAALQLLRAVEEDIVPGTVGAWGVVSAEVGKPVPWDGGRVVLIGDAMHTMPPTAGAGGAAALRDAESLAKTILSSAEVGGSGGPLDTLLGPFVQEMTTRSEGYLKDAVHRLDVANQSGAGAYMRRGLLGAMDLCWPLADWVLNRGRESAKQEIDDGHVVKPAASSRQGQ